MGISRTTLVVDGNNILVRAVKALEHRARMSTEVAGEEVNTGPVVVFINMLTKYVSQVQPDRMVVCWDGGRSTHRLAIFEHYKSARPDHPDEEKDLTPFSLAKEFLTLAGIHHLEMPGVEADDLVAATWHRKGNDDRLIILSGDKDFLQLLDGWTEQIRPGAGTDERWTSNRVRTEMGTKPEHIPYVMALTGDSGDGVPGIPGFGQKTACKALAHFDWDLHRLIEEGPYDEKWAKKLAFQGDAIRRNLALVDLRNPIGIEVGEPPRFEPTEPSSILYQELLDWMSRYQMESLHHRLSSGTLWR